MARSPGLAAVVLAAGDGRRLKSDLPKVLHPAAGRPLLAHVLAALAPLPIDESIVVRGRNHDVIEGAMEGEGFDGLVYAIQDPPRGTADAARVGLDALREEPQTVIVASGDMPLLETDTFYRMLEAHSASASAATVLSAIMHGHTDLGRIVRDGDDVVNIIEARDATEAELRIREVNAGVYVFDAALLRQMLDKVDTENTQAEYYLTDVIELLSAAGHKVRAMRTDEVELTGVNNRAQLAYASGLIRQRVCQRWMDEGVSIVDPHTTYIDTTVTIGRDATIHPFTFIEGRSSVGEGAEVGPQVRLVDTSVGPGATVTFAVAHGSKIGADSIVGPYASLRPGTVMSPGAKIGTFVESKNTVIGAGSKVNHLTYVGDAEIGERVNVGAGTVTCNWDGRTKHKTVIEDDVYVGSDTMFVAPVRIGKRAATGAGSVVNKDVPDDALAVGVPVRILRERGDRMGRKKS